MIEYVAVYDGTNTPRCVKRITLDSGEIVDTPISFEFQEEIKNFSNETIYKHLDNLMQYIKDVSVGITPVPLGEEPPESGWHIKGGWDKIEWAKEESFKWWSYVYFKEEGGLA